MEEKLKFNQTPHLSIEDLKAHIPQKDYFIGIDSDGTVFDSMELKHKDCFIGSLIRVFQIASIAHEVHQVWNYVNISSKTRGTNRFKALILTFKHLNTMNRVKELGIELPNLNSLKHWSDSSSSLGNDSLSEYIASDISVEKKDLKVVLESSQENEKKQNDISKQISNNKKMGRNEPCFCGSGKKFKHCHGAL